MKLWKGRDPSIFILLGSVLSPLIQTKKEFSHVLDTFGIYPGCPRGMSIGFLSLSAEQYLGIPRNRTNRKHQQLLCVLDSRGIRNIFSWHRCLNLPEVPRHPPTPPPSALNCWLWSVVSAESIRFFGVLQGLNYVLPPLDSNRLWKYGLSRNSLQKRSTSRL